MNRLKIEDAKVLLLESIELDPSFAEAHQQLAYCYWWNAGITTDAASGQKRMYDAAVKAIDLDPNLLFAHAFRAAGTLDNDAFLREIEALERVTREQPSNAEAREALISDLLEAGYYREALRVAEQLIELDPLSGPAQFRLSQSLRVVGRASEAVRVLEFASELGIDIEWALGRLALLDQRDEDGIAHFETFLDGVGRSSTWVRDLVTHARNPESGQAYLDQHIPQIVASMPEEEASNTRYQLSQFYLNFGFLDRYFELIFASEPSGSGWSSEMMLVYDGLTSPRSGFIAHPRFLEVAEATGLIHLWEKRGPPDFCEKLDGQWICE
jgi:tetratricopeptide (TPR) repeat protein